MQMPLIAGVFHTQSVPATVTHTFNKTRSKRKRDESDDQQTTCASSTTERESEQELRAVTSKPYQHSTCPICTEFLCIVNGTVVQGSARKTAEFREHIFRFEETFRGKLRDCDMFTHMLALRRTFIEQVLTEHKIPFTPWTRDHLRKHYGERHFTDIVRDIRADIEHIHELTELMRGQWTRIDEEGEEHLDLNVIREYAKIKKCEQDLRKEYEQKLASRESAFGAQAARAVITAIHQSGGIKTKLIGDSEFAKHVADMYTLGGI